MNPELHQFISLDLPPLLTAIFAALSCALLGNFLLLRRLALMGDAISHSVLPGIVVGFLLSGTRETWPVLLGAIIAGILSSVLVEVVQRIGRVEPGAAMGVIFTIFFAIGVLLIEQAAARSVDLDADCLLHGQLETIFWFPPADYGTFFSLTTLAELPGEVGAAFFMFLAAGLFVSVLFKELTLASFDSGLATALGFRPGLLHYALMVFIAGAVVISFEAVGSILVIAMIICPAATARLMTDRLRTQVLLSLLFSVLSVVLGYVAALFLPRIFGSTQSLNAAGMMAVASGFFLFSSALLAPEYGVLGRLRRHFGVAVRVAEEDLLAGLYREEETGRQKVSAVAGGGRWKLAEKLALSNALRRGFVSGERRNLQLTASGREAALEVIRSHRLWETYLVERGFRSDHVHERATQLEHFTTPELSTRLAEGVEQTKEDPHGRMIPAKDRSSKS